MELFHTSPRAITEIGQRGRFGEFLCFAREAYSMSPGAVITYKIDIDEESIIESSQLFYHPDAEKLSELVSRVMSLADCDEDTAEELISQREDVHSLDHIDSSDAAELSWDIQRIAAEAAKILGFRGVSMQDEQGTCYMIDMLGREDELERV